MKLTMLSKLNLFVSTIVLSSMVSSCTQATSKSELKETQASASVMPSMSGMNHSQPGGMSHPDMDLGPANANYDLRFIDAMTPRTTKEPS